jgi:hypothetical protein
LCCELLLQPEYLVAQTTVVLITLLSPGRLLLQQVLPDVGFFLTLKVLAQPLARLLPKRPHHLGHASLLGLLVQVLVPEALDLGNVLLNLLPQVNQLLLSFLRLLVVSCALLVIGMAAPSRPGALLLVLELLLELLDTPAQDLVVAL